jgi:CubicO group peptidase (beta-lactamase class C family)/D-alanyl-D-alanine dipeptidase
MCIAGVKLMRVDIFRLCLICAWLTALVERPAVGQDTVGPLAGYEAVAERVEQLVCDELTDKRLPAVSIALVDDQRIVWAAGFGVADPLSRTPATAETVYRVGSVSKLFADLALMQLVEDGRIDLDLPVSWYFADFHPNNPFGKPITLRQMMSHRSGLVREPPVGHYFDPTGPTLAETVASLNRTALVYPPESRTKYSNAAVAAVGRVLEAVRQRPFAECIDKSLLAPLGTERTSFEPTAAVREKLATGQMWSYDGRNVPTPTFPLGASAAGNLYSNVLDLSRLVMALFAGGQAKHGRLVKAETLERMYEPQFAGPGESTVFGIGFHISQLDGCRRVGHGGAMYGFATELAALPDLKLGVVVIATRDLANAVVEHIADESLRLLLARRADSPLAAPRRTHPLTSERVKELAGRYECEDHIVDLTEQGGRLLVRQGDFRVGLKLVGDDLIVDDVLAFGARIARAAGGDLVIGGRTYSRVASKRPEPAPRRWRGLIGEYGWDHDTLFILEDEGRLTALIEWFFYYPLDELGPDEFKFPDDGLYAGERLLFRRDASGRATQVKAASVDFARRPFGADDPATRPLEPHRPLAQLRREALAAQPPVEKGEFLPSDLVDLTELDATFKFDIRYATTNNFLGTVFYDAPEAFMQRPAAAALVRVQRRLKEVGYALLIHDAYRPWHVTKMFWDATPQEARLFVADPAKGSRHNRGAAVDLTLYDLADDEPVAMPSDYDEFSPRAFPGYPGGTSRERWHREVLRNAMEAEGFSVFEYEWWHFDYRDWQRYPIMNLTFDEVLDDHPNGE